MSSADKSHKCEALVLMCIDFRFREQMQEKLQKKGLKNYDLLAYPGASLCLSSAANPAQKPLLDAINISKNLHDTKKVVIVEHEDCGAYGGSSSFESLDDEIAAHKEKLTLAVKAIEAEIGLPCIGYFAKLDGEFSAL